MKKELLIVIITCLLATANSFAQKKDSIAYAITDKMKTDLVLTDQQYPSVLAINQDFVNELKVLQNSSEEKMYKFKVWNKASKKRDSALKGLLTSTQYQKFEENKKENREKMKEYRSK